MKINNSSIMLFGTIGLALISGCGSKGAPTSTDTNDLVATSEKQTLTVKGSDTMVQLAQAWAQDFMKDNPNISVTVTGGGSNTGIAALMNKGTDIANASRPMKSEETDKAKESGVAVQEFTVAQDALSIVVNPKNTISALTLAQLKDIYQGKVTNWKQIGGPDMNIVVNSRETSSGTYTFFQEHVLKKEPFADAVMYQPATSQIITSVSQDDGGIGFVGLGFVSEAVKSIPIKKDDASPAVTANVENVLNATYPLARPLFEYTPGTPSATAQIWLDWVRGVKGQKIVEDLGFVPVKK